VGYFEFDLGEVLVAQRYRVGRQIGFGGMGVVCEAVHEGTGRKVALKIVRDVTALGEEKSAWLARFRQEARAVGALDTPHIVQVFDAGTDEATGEPFIAMELLSGSDLSRLLKELGPLPPEIALKVVGQACLALERAHDAGVIHRDVKPGNVYLADSKDDEVIVKLVDFGIAKVVSEEISGPEYAELTQTGSLLGTPTYMSPEQAKGLKTLDRRTDLWALAVVLYKALTNHVPHPKREGLGQLIVSICTEAAPPVQDYAPWVPPQVGAILDQALQLEIERRFQSANEFRLAIEHVVGTEFRLARHELRALTEAERSVVAKRHVSAFPPPVRPGRRSDGGAEESRTQPGIVQSAEQARTRFNGLRWALAVVATIGLIGASVTYLQRRHSAPSADPEPSVASPSPPSTTMAASAVTQIDSRVVSVEVVPTSAYVEVDGEPVVVRDGAITVAGKLGSAHQVKLLVGGRESTTKVAITQTGAIPGKVVLELPASTRATARGNERASPKPPPAKSSKPPDEATPKPATSKGGVGVVSVFE
jgi:eukaryotic-like serine/threonine-protein kinase